MDAITDYAYDNGFVLFSEQDVKQFYLSLADRVKEDAQSRFIHTIVEMYSKATDGPSRLYVTVNNGDALKAWVAKQFDRICQRMEKGDQDFLRDSNTQEIKAELLAHVSPGGVIVSLQAWHILEQLIIRKAKGKKPWWQELDFMVRKGDLSFRTAQNIKMFHIVLQTVLANGDYASALDPDLLVTLTLIGFVFSTKLTGVELR